MLLYRLYLLQIILLQIILLLASVLFHGLAQTIAVISLILVMAFLLYVLWGAARLAALKAKRQTYKDLLEKIEQHK